MMKTILCLASALALNAGVAQACDMHGDDYAPMTAYIDYRGMTELEMRLADAKALDEAHERARTRAMDSARYSLVSRFNIKVDTAPTVETAQTEGASATRASVELSSR